ncbi:3-beta-hydroxysteroid dehydrogenase [compost metagenome]|uniref:3(Or 17)beta-hydroxysteroid dehydrogenase n=1 Tax=Pseudomonas jinjuensis TaxID=198616 RepID=A0A1H0R344_9PSED|nr:glucose 1-dehydrogenase [Pseudomonas jinjuensis]SDP23944.1 3(or 17)beta-hydroxysteroid dehydrogenase [Pseudomonas jinjuensis]
MSNRLINKVAIVTGAASGVGEATARQFIAEGARVIMTDLNAEAGRRIADELGGNALFVQQDVGSPEAWRELATLVRERYQRLDVLVNNAGILIPGTIEEASLEDWHKLLRINSDSVFLGCQTALELMTLSGGGGSIVNMSSIAAIAGRDDYVAYSASKGAVAALTRSVAAHCRRRKYRIRCNSVHPDGILTAMTRASYPKGVDPARFTIDSDPMNRACLPEDVAHAVVYLASDESRAVNGIELRVDSGQFVMSI